LRVKTRQRPERALQLAALPVAFPDVFLCFDQTITNAFDRVFPACAEVKTPHRLLSVPLFQGLQEGRVRRLEAWKPSSPILFSHFKGNGSWRAEHPSNLPGGEHLGAMSYGSISKEALILEVAFHRWKKQFGHIEVNEALR